jgi:hypothetical protein
MASSRLYGHACKVWSAMAEQAVPVAQLRGRDRYLAGMVPVGSYGVFIGSLMHLVEAQGHPSRSTYHYVKNALVRCGCIAQLRRGAGYITGAWALLTRPSEELWEARIGPIGRRGAAEVSQREQHERALLDFLAHPPTSRDLQTLVRAAGASSGEQLVKFLAALPVERQHALGLPCLGDAVVGAAHTCEWSPEEEHATPALA